MKKVAVLIAIVLVSCNMGHKEVRYSEMTTPPTISLTQNGLLVKTSNSKEYPGFVIYEVQPTVDEIAKVILLKGLEARGRKVVNEFKLDLRHAREDSISAYKIVWLDPDNKKTELKIQRD